MSHFLQEWGPTLAAAGGVTFLGAAGMSLTTLGPWYRQLQKPSWQPPDWLFGPAWTLIFILEAASFVIGWHSVHSPGATALFIGVYLANGLFNILWSYLFFTLRRPDFAVREAVLLWLSVASIMLVLHQYAGPAWIFLLPYLLWVSFAIFLNLTIIRLNAPFGSAA